VTGTERPSPTLPRVLTCTIFILLFLITPCAGGDTGEKMTVMLLLSYNQGFAWTDDVVAGVVSVLPPDSRTDLRIEYMDTKHATGKAYFDDLAAIYREKYRDTPPDVIIASEEDAYQFLREYKDTLFPGTPVVVVGLNWRPDRQIPERPDFTGVMEDYEIPRTIDLALSLHPETKNLVIVNDNISTAGKENALLLREILPEYEDRVSVTVLENLPSTDVEEALRPLPRESVVLLLTYNTDAAGRGYTYDETAARVRSATDVPIYGVWDFYLGKGIVGGYMTRGSVQGETAAEMAAAILDGKSVEDVPPVVARPEEAFFDYKELQRFGIPDSALPTGSIVINHPPDTVAVEIGTLWTAAIGGLLLLLLLVTLTATNRRLKATEDRLRKSEERLSTALDATNDGLWDWHIPDGTAYFSPGWYRMLGYDPDEFSPSFSAWEALLFPDDREGAVAALTGAVQDEEGIFKAEFRMRTKDGGWKWILGRGRVVERENGMPLRMTGLNTDVTARRMADDELALHRRHLADLVAVRTADLDRAVGQLKGEIEERKTVEANLATEKERLAVTLRSIADGVIATGTDGRIVLMNRAAEALTRWSQEEAEGKDLAAVLRVLDPKTGKMFAGPVSSTERDGLLLRKNGDERLISCSVAPIRGPEQRVTGSVIVVRDVTAERHAEEEMVRTQKLESVGLLAGGIAHDFNNFLMAILANIQFAEDGLAADDERCTYLKDAENALFRARDLTAQLLTFARGGAPVREARHLTGMITETTAFTLRGSGVRPVFEIEEGLWPVDVDIGQISQVIGNLVLNAAQAMAGGGNLTVRARNTDITDARPSLRPGRYVRIEVTDTGPGIDPAHLGKIFDPYFTTKAHGRGLGLSSSLSIVRRHEGTIDVSSTPGLGTSFTVYLPASESAPREERMEAPRTQDNGGRRRRVLIMDDEEGIREVMALMLGRKGFAVETAADGAAALECYGAAQARGEPFDAVVLDLTVPGGMGGKETVERLLTLDPDAKAIASSGYSDDPVMASYSEYGFAAALPKPFRVDDLVAVLDEIVGMLRGAVRS
jgi:PAS domain S-box-containing protein